MSIVVFDSGIGGFSILKKLLELKIADIHYIADQKYFPYGSKSQNFITNRIKKVIKWASRLNPNIFVIACNSATTSSIKEIREYSSLQIVGVEPVIKPLMNFSKTVVLTTPTTAKSKHLHDLMKLVGGERVKVKSIDNLAQSVEDMDQKKSQLIINNLFNSLKNFDAIGLSCTHYPLVKDLFIKSFPKTSIIDPSVAVSKRINYLYSGQRKKGKTTFYTTGEVVRLKSQISHYLNINIEPNMVEI